MIAVDDSDIACVFLCPLTKSPQRSGVPGLCGCQGFETTKAAQEVSLHRCKSHTKPQSDSAPSRNEGSRGLAFEHNNTANAGRWFLRIGTTDAPTPVRPALLSFSRSYFTAFDCGLQLFFCEKRMIFITICPDTAGGILFCDRSVYNRDIPDCAAVLFARLCRIRAPEETPVAFLRAS